MADHVEIPDGCLVVVRAEAVTLAGEEVDQFCNDLILEPGDLSADGLARDWKVTTWRRGIAAMEQKNAGMAPLREGVVRGHRLVLPMWNLVHKALLAIWHDYADHRYYTRAGREVVGPGRGETDR